MTQGGDTNPGPRPPLHHPSWSSGSHGEQGLGQRAQPPRQPRAWAVAVRRACRRVGSARPAVELEEVPGAECVCLGFSGLAQAVLLFWEPRPPVQEVAAEGRAGRPLWSHVSTRPQEWPAPSSLASVLSPACPAVCPRLLTVSGGHQPPTSARGQIYPRAFALAVLPTRSPLCCLHISVRPAWLPCPLHPFSLQLSSLLDIFPIHLISS